MLSRSGITTISKQGSYAPLQCRVRAIAKWAGDLLQSEAIIIAKQGSYYKVRKLLQSGLGIIKCGSSYKLRQCKAYK